MGMPTVLQVAGIVGRLWFLLCKLRIGVILIGVDDIATVVQDQIHGNPDFLSQC